MLPNGDWELPGAIYRPASPRQLNQFGINGLRGDRTVKMIIDGSATAVIGFSP